MAKGLVGLVSSVWVALCERSSQRGSVGRRMEDESLTGSAVCKCWRGFVIQKDSDATGSIAKKECVNGMNAQEEANHKSGKKTWAMRSAP